MRSITLVRRSGAVRVGTLLVTGALAAFTFGAGAASAAPVSRHISPRLAYGFKAPDGLAVLGHDLWIANRAREFGHRTCRRIR